jgi:hypothetical protein
MEGHIGRTRDKVEGVGQKVAATNFGTQTMGVVGTGMTGTLNNTLSTAQEHVARASKAVEDAGAQTKAVRQGYETTESNAVAALNKTSKDAAAPPAKPASTSGSTTPSGAGSSGNGGTTPSSGGPPPPHNPPSGGGGHGGPPGGGGASGAPPAKSWRDSLKDHFTPSEQKELDTAFKKMAAEPTPGEVAGSGRLTQRERELAAEAQKLVTITPGTTMQKVIPPGDVDKYLSGQYTQVGGFVARQQDATHLTTPDDLVQGNRLDYTLGDNTPGPFHRGMEEVHAIEFKAGDPANYQIPFGAPHGGASGLDDADPAVVRARGDMIAGAQTAGLDPKSYYDHHQKWPFSGIGVTADANLGVPERVMSRQDFQEGDTMYKYPTTGPKIRVAVFHLGVGWVLE